MRVLWTRHQLVVQYRALSPLLHSPASLSIRPGILCPPRRRTFLGIFGKPPRQIKRAEIEPGWTRIMQWRTAMLQNIRPPPHHMLVKAFQQFFTYKRQFNISVNRTQALVCRGLLRWLMETKVEGGDPELSIRELAVARNSLLKAPNEDSADHLSLSRDLYENLQKLRHMKALPRPETRLVAAASTAPDAESSEALDGTEASGRDFQLYILALTQFGASSEATRIFADYRTRRGRDSCNENTDTTLWLYILRGLAREGNEVALREQLELAESTGCYFTRQFHEVMTLFYASQDLGEQAPELVAQHFESIKYWFNKPIEGDFTPTPTAYREVLKFCLRHGYTDWVNPVFESLMRGTPSAPLYPLWDVVLEWSALVNEPGGLDLEDIVVALLDRLPEGSRQWPSPDTFNGLLRCAVESEKGDLIKQVLSVAAARKIAPNDLTRVILLDGAIRRNDVAAALEEYERFRHFDSAEGDDIPVINKFIRKLCSVGKIDFNAIKMATGNLEERSITLEPDTVVALCMLYLRYERHLDIMDVLSLNVFQFSLEHQRQVEKAFVTFCLDSTKSTAKVWNAYQVLSQFFFDIDMTTRLDLITCFFQRKRPDMATEVLTKMREHKNSDFQPSLEVYIQHLELLGRCPDDDSLETVRNMINLDTKIQPSTRLLNALMIAFSSSGAPSKVLDIWGDITHSLEGPSYASLEIIFASCARFSFLQSCARKIWRKLSSLDVEVTPAVYIRYTTAIGKGEFLQEAMDLLENMQNVVGSGPNSNDLALVYNHLSGPKDKALFESWTQTKYPAQWAPLEKLRRKRGPKLSDIFRVPNQLHA